jgi:hypothetical protein
MPAKVHGPVEERFNIRTEGLQVWILEVVFLALRWKVRIAVIRGIK